MLAGSLAVSALALAGFVAMIDAADRSRFGNEVAATEDLVRDRLDHHTTLLLATRGLFHGDDPVTADEFRRYIEGLELDTRFPGIQGIGFARATGERYEIEMIEPLDRRNAAALGFDMASEPIRRAAIERARDTGAPAASARVTLVQEIDGDKQPGFLIYVPVYAGAPATVEERRAAILGVVYAPFRARDLFHEIFDAGRPPVDFVVHDGARPADDAEMFRVRERGHARRFEEVRRLDVAGRPWTVSYRSTAAFEADSARRLVPAIALAALAVNVMLFAVTRSLVRARARADAARANLHRLFTDAPAAIAILRGPDLRYELSNPLNVELSGGRALPGRRVSEALPELDAQGLSALARRVLETGEPLIASELPVELDDARGRRRVYLSGTYQPLRGDDGAIEGMMAFAYDVTAQVEARQRVEALAEDLARAVRVRDDFLSIAGHELRTPLSALVLQLDAVRRQLERAPLDVDKARQRLGKALGAIDRLEALIHELLDVARITAGRMELRREEVDLATVAAEVVERHAEQAARAGSTIALDAHAARGQWDRLRVEQVVTNLVSNAVKYGAGQPIEVAVAADGDRARIVVRDHGIGIPPEDRARVFERFERAVSDRHYGGLGLGLWISRQIVEAHGGRIAVDDAEGGGSAFTVELPGLADASRSTAA